MSNNNWTYNKVNSQMITGVGIILILLLHLWGNRAWKLEGNECLPFLEYNGFSLMRLLGRFASICVSVFAFNTGYGIWVKNDDFISPRKNIVRGLKFVVSYWVILLLYFALFSFTGDTYPDLQTFLYNLIGLQTGVSNPYINVVFAWYVAFYILILILAPLFELLIRKSKNYYTDGLIVIGLSLLFYIVGSKIGLPESLSDISYNIHILDSVLLGMICAKYELIT